jgi:hemoglobin-like flavoprotein
MTAREIVIIKKNWHLFRSIDPKLIGEVFYGRLFLKMPALRPMFKISMEEQYIKIVDMLSLLVARLDRIEELDEEIRQMAIRHVQYGVREEHYALVGDAMLWTLEKGLGKDWTPETASAWAGCYTLLSEKMIKAAYS